MAQPTNADTEQESRVTGTKSDDALPLPKWLTKIYYIFPIVLYVPDMLFNFYVYSDGSGLNVNNILSSATNVFYAVLWFFLAAGIVGMAWLCSVLAPWHWIKGNKFQSVMCWFGVIIATCITIWNSLAYRSLDFKNFQTDKWLQDATHISGLSLTMVLVSVAPPFWGLFWAIVQPAVGRKSLAEEQESHAMKLERLKQEAEYKRLRAEANAQVRSAQLKGLAATVRSARAQVTGRPESEPQEQNGAQQTTSDIPTGSDRVVALPTASIRRLSERRTGWGDETTESGEHDIVRGAAASMSYSAAAAPRDDVFEAPSGEFALRPMQGTLMGEGRATDSGEHQTALSTSRPGMPRASTLLRNYADGEHVMRAVDGDVERMRAQGMKVTIKSFAEYRGIELSLAKQLLAKWREWKQAQSAPRAEMAE
jgi:hypothetical protein